MAVDVVMPMFSETMEEGTILRWLKRVGDPVSTGEDLVEIETEKATMTYPSDTAGVLIEVLADEGATLPVGTLIARIGSSDEAGVPSRTEPPSEPAEPERVGREGVDRISASPLVRRVAAEMGVDLLGVRGTGPGGRITRPDLERAVAGGSVQAAEPESAEAAARLQPLERSKGNVRVVELTRSQQAMARRVSESKAAVPHFYLTVEADATDLLAARARPKERASDEVPSFNGIVVKASSLALLAHPRANSAYRNGRLEQYSRINVGIAVASADALMVPTIFDADKKSVPEIAREARELIEKVRTGSITEAELAGGTFTVSNLGMFGIDSFAAVINPPQAAILAVGRLRRKPIVDSAGAIVAKDFVSLTLSCDHRVLTGVDGSKLLVRIAEALADQVALGLPAP